VTRIDDAAAQWGKSNALIDDTIPLIFITLAKLFLIKAEPFSKRPKAATVMAEGLSWYVLHQEKRTRKQEMEILKIRGSLKEVAQRDRVDSQ
jgi:hypothetical protein